MTREVDPDWYKDAVVYAVDVERFFDGNGDGVGDFPGLTARLDYLAGLGVTCLWILPFYPTPNRDNGYDITDCCGVDPRLGTLDDFRAFRRAATARGIRLILDLVIHHTSDEHPWFQAARADPRSPYRDYYVWTNNPPDHSPAKVVFPGVEESLWTFDDAAGAYYLHQFYDFQPDLNIENPAVQEEIRRIMAFWRDLGADGFRIDAASHLFGTDALRPAAQDQPHAILHTIRNFLDDHRAGGVLVAEADVVPDELATYFGAGESRAEMHVLFNFLLDNYLFLALARGEAEPIERAMGLLPDKSAEAGWAIFVRNLDEVDLEQLSEAEREEVYRAFAPEERMRSYGKGIRRRLAPMLGGDPARLRLAFSLLLTLPGMPVIPYGDEIGLGDDLSLPEREGVRPAMQWSAAPNGGFSIAAPERVSVPVVPAGPFAPERINVEEQMTNSESLLNWIRRAIAIRKGHSAFARGTFVPIETGVPAVLAHRCAWNERDVIAVHNLGGRPCAVELELDALAGQPLVNLLDATAAGPDKRGPVRIELAAYDLRWFGPSPVAD